MTTNPSKDRARNAVAKAIRDGLLVRGPCEQEASGVCTERILAHHDDYSKPLEVRWMCDKHHRRFHVDNPDVVRDSRSPIDGVRLAVSLSPEIYERFCTQASEDNRSLSNQAALFIKQELDRIAAGGEPVVKWLGPVA